VPYYVTGGRFADTTFRDLVEPAPVLGPFPTHEAALDAWRERARATIDYATVRYLITWREESAGPPAPAPLAPDAAA